LGGSRGMFEKPGIGLEEVGLQRSGGVCPVSDVRLWFAREILPLEASLIQFLRNNWRNETEIEDLLQEIYVRVFEAAREETPVQAKPFIFTTARNLLINRIRQRQVVPIESVADLDSLSISISEPSPERSVIARDELRRLQAALDRLPPRVREAVLLRRVEGLSRREIAMRMQIGEGTVKDYLADAMNMLSDMLYRESEITRKTA
jgi:RNA polymerase sigma factor (sigma-70 family)